MSLIKEFISFCLMLKDIFQFFKKNAGEKWFQKLGEVQKAVNHAKTPNEKKAAAKMLSDILSDL